MALVLKILVGVVALLLALLGVRWMFMPESVAVELGIVLGSAEALNTARGDLGGMFLAAAGLCALGLRSGDGRWLQAVAAVIGCVAVGRLVGIVLDGFSATAGTSIAVEVVMVAILLSAARPPAASAT
jgi:hypothetical protein